MPVVRPSRVAGEHRVRDNAQTFARNAQLCEHTRAVLAVDDHAGEAAQQASPELALRGRAPRQEVMRREDGRIPEAQEARVELRRRQPLQVQDVGPPAIEPREPRQVLPGLQGEPQRRAAEQTRGEGVEELLATVALGRGHVAESERRGDELDVRAGTRKRRGERVVVRRRECGRVCDQDAHGT